MIFYSINLFEAQNLSLLRATWCADMKQSLPSTETNTLKAKCSANTFTKERGFLLIYSLQKSQQTYEPRVLKTLKRLQRLTSES